MHKDHAYLIILAFFVTAAIYAALIPHPFEEELKYYRIKGYILLETDYQDFKEILDYSFVEKNVSREELREFANVSRWRMGHKLIYYDKDAKVIWVGRFYTPETTIDVRLFGKFLICRWMK